MVVGSNPAVPTIENNKDLIMPKRYLIIKMSSLGDVIHTFPAITEAKKHNPEIIFDWVVEESFADIIKLHPSVDQIIPIAFRRWRKNIIKYWKNGEIKTFLKSLRKQKYDAIIDAQGLFKSALIAKLAKGKIIGLDKKSAREGWVSLFYKKSFFVAKNQHAVLRVKSLFAQFFHYQADENVDYGLSFKWEKDKISKQKTICFLHATTWQSKHWPLISWQELAKKLTEKNVQIVLPWGNEKEKKQAELIAGDFNHVIILPKMSLTELAESFSKYQLVISVDTGLSHLAAAIETPTISLYGATNPKLTSTMGKNQIHLNANFHCAPCLKRVCQYKKEDYKIHPPCYETISAEHVYQIICQNDIFQL